MQCAAVTISQDIYGRCTPDKYTHIIKFAIRLTSLGLTHACPNYVFQMQSQDLGCLVGALSLCLALATAPAHRIQMMLNANKHSNVKLHNT